MCASAVTGSSTLLQHNPLRKEVLHWYKKILTAAFNFEWEDDSHALYILTEARALFRQNMHLRNIQQISKKVEEAEKRYGLAMHYRTPFLRNCHFAAGGLRWNRGVYMPEMDSQYGRDGVKFGRDVEPGSPGYGLAESSTCGEWGTAADNEADYDEDR